jgi:hypothetical protein
MQVLKTMGAIVVLAAVGPAFALSTYPQIAYAQTHGMNRPDDRRDTRQGARSAKQACKAGDEKSRSECRQTKRDVKLEGRRNGTPKT